MSVMGYLSNEHIMSLLANFHSNYVPLWNAYYTALNEGRDVSDLNRRIQDIRDSAMNMLRGANFKPVYRPPVIVAAIKLTTPWQWSDGNNAMIAKAGDFAVTNGTDLWSVDALAFQLSYSQTESGLVTSTELEKYFEAGYLPYIKTGITWARQSLTPLHIMSMESVTPWAGNPGDYLLVGVLFEVWGMTREKFEHPQRGYVSAEKPAYAEKEIFSHIDEAVSAIMRGDLVNAQAILRTMRELGETFGFDQARTLDTEGFAEVVKSSLT